MESSSFAKARMLIRSGLFLPLFLNGLSCGIHFNLFCVSQAKRQFIAMKVHLDRVTHWRVFDYFDFRTGNNPHVKEVLSERAFTSNCQYGGGITDL